MNRNSETKDSGPSPAHLPKRIRSALQLRMDLLDLVLNTHRQAAEIAVNKAQQVMGRAPATEKGIDFFGSASNRVNALGRDILGRFRNAVEPKEGTSDDSVQDHSASKEPTIRISSRCDEDKVVVPLKLQNHRPEIENVALSITPFKDSNGLEVPAKSVHLSPDRLEIEGKGSGMVEITIQLSPEFQAGGIYESEILIEGTEEKRVALILSVLPPDPQAGTAADVDVNSVQND